MLGMSMEEMDWVNMFRAYNSETKRIIMAAQEPLAYSSVIAALQDASGLPQLYGPSMYKL